MIKKIIARQLQAVLTLWCRVNVNIIVQKHQLNQQQTLQKLRQSQIDRKSAHLTTAERCTSTN